MNPAPRIRIAPWRLALWSLPYLATGKNQPRTARAPFWPGYRHLLDWYLKNGFPR